MNHIQHQHNLIDLLSKVNEAIKYYRSDCLNLIGSGTPEVDALNALQDLNIEHSRLLKDIFKII